MARIRTIKPEFPQSESMGKVSRDARLCFIEMWTIADDEGRLRGASRMLASLLFPYDDDAPAMIDGWLLELEREHCIVRYQADGSSYIQIAKWLEHQKIDKPSKSKIPQFDDTSRNLAKPRECSSEDLRTKDQGSKDQGSVDSASAPTKRYAFEGKVVRLAERDFQHWEQVYRNVPNLRAELTGRDEWLSEQPKEIQAKWFQSTSTWLANKDAGHANKARAFPKSQPDRKTRNNVVVGSPEWKELEAQGLV